MFARRDARGAILASNAAGSFPRTFVASRGAAPADSNIGSKPAHAVDVAEGKI